MEIKVEKPAIKIQLGDKSFELSLDDARVLQYSLEEALGKHPYAPSTQPWVYPEPDKPFQPWVYPQYGRTFTTSSADGTKIQSMHSTFFQNAGSTHVKAEHAAQGSGTFATSEPSQEHEP